MRSAGKTAVTDRFGSVRANSNGERMNYFPYGEERTSTTDGREKFGTYFRDLLGQDYADQRYYSSLSGRFWTPDPSGLKPVDRGNPGTWNAYVYALGNPLYYIDPTGLHTYYDGDDAEPDETCDENYCWSGGGDDAPEYDDGGESDDSDQNNTSPPSGTQCGPPKTGFGLGVIAGASGEAGVGVAGAAVQGSVGAGVFANGNGGSTGVYASGGATAYAGNNSVGAPTQQTSPGAPGVAGLFAGYGPGVFFTNAGTVQQLSGPFWTATVNIGFGPGQASVSIGSSNGILILTITGGLNPYAAGVGASGSIITTTTAAWGTSKCP